MPLLRQIGTSVVAASVPPFEKNMNDKSWLADRLIFVTEIAKAIAQADGTELSDVEKFFKEKVDAKFSNQLVVKKKLAEPKSALETGTRALTRSILGLSPALRKIRARRQREAMIAELSSNGVSRAQLDDLGLELDAIEETLCGSGFPAFVRDVAPELLQ